MAAPRTITDATRAMRHGETTSLELTADALACAERLNGRLRIFVSMFRDSALAIARERDDELSRGIDRGPLHGIPLGVKDNIATTDGPTTGQSAAMEPSWGAQGEGAAVQRLRDAGVVVVGKTTLMEFAGGLVDSDNPFGVPRNPWDPSRWPGGSSSGSGSGVAVGTMLGSLGTDTGGSIRCPAAFCGVTGLRPSQGLVSVDRVIPWGPSFDTVGPIARSAEDCGLLLAALTGDRDFRSLSSDLTGVRVGVHRAAHRGYPQAVASLDSRLDDVASVLTSCGASVRETVVSGLNELAELTVELTRVEGSNFHAAFSGARRDLYGRDFRAAVDAGVKTSPARRRQLYALLEEARSDLQTAFADLDAVVMMTAPTTAPRLDGMLDKGVLPEFTAGWSALGCPAVSIPIEPENGLPLGAQIVARPERDALVLGMAAAYQKATAWHLMVPPTVVESS